MNRSQNSSYQKHNAEQEAGEQLSNEEIAASYRQLWSYLLPQFRFFVFAVIGFLLYALSQPAFAMLMEAFVEALEGELVEHVYLVPVACAVIALVRGIGSYMGTYYMAKVTERMMHAIRSDLFARLIYLPLGYFDQNKTGRLLSLFTYNTNVMTNTTARAVTIVIREGLTVVALFSYLIYQNAKLTLLFVVLGPPIAWLISWMGKKIKKLGHGIQSSMGEINHIVSENLQGIRLLKSVAAEDHVNETFVKRSAKTLKLALRMAKVKSIYTPVMQIMVVLVLAALMYVVLLVRDSMSSAELIAYVTAAAMLPKPIRSLSSVHPYFLQGAVAGAEVFKQISQDREINEGEIATGSISGQIEFSGVEFSYPGSDEAVLNGLSVSVRPGETLAVIGRSGGGKSTLANLIPRFYSPTKGAIKVDGVPIEQYRLEFLRKNIAIVSQDVTLFNASALENLAFGSENVDRAMIIEAAKAANAHEFIEQLPHGYDTEIGENGVLLSGGQRQRLAIARAILRDTPILILDEATSALDNESEVKVQVALERVMQNRTTIIIAHRLSTIEHADNIIVLDQGRIIEQGNHQNLLDHGGFYAQMLQRDFSGESS